MAQETLLCGKGKAGASEDLFVVTADEAGYSYF